MKVLVTGSAGFIGFHTSLALLARGDKVIGVDNLNNYYDVSLKESRNKILLKNKNYKFYKSDIANYPSLLKIFSKEKPDKVIHLAAQAGVRYSISNPFAYEESNLKGFLSVLEGCRASGINSIVYASSSSVYGNNKKTPFSESDKVDEPISLYAATKKSNEETAYVYHNLFGINSIGLRFFTVYGPYGRPDMALFSFVKNIVEGKPIELYNNGEMERDFTYIDDIVEGVLLSLDKCKGYEIINLGRGESRNLGEFVSSIESALKINAKKELLPLQKGDVLVTSADISKAKKLLGYSPKTSINDGIKKFVEWYKEYYKV